MSNKILLLCGDPNSINSEIIYRSWNKLSSRLKKNIYLLGNFRLLSVQYKRLKIKNNLVLVSNLKDKKNIRKLKVIDFPLKFNHPFKVNSKESSKYIIKTLNYAHNLAITGKVKGLINCPINKKLLNKTGIGVTEYLANKSRIVKNSEVMMIHNANLSVVPLTTHVKIKDVSKKINKKMIIKKIQTLNKYYKKITKKTPKIAILGLNPHNAEFSKSSEEITQILPAIRYLKKRGIKIYGPLSADTAFMSGRKNYNVIVGAYHDQVLTPFKSLFNFDAINLTLGLKYIRLSPDHGPALDLVGKNKANYFSLLKCIKFLDNQK